MRRTTFRTFIRLIACTSAFGRPAQDLNFEVASVKPSPPVSAGQRIYFGPPHGGPGTPDPGQITWTYAFMKSLLMTAYDVKGYQIVGPAWITDQQYDIVAKVPEGATKEQVRSMWQNLLAERFGLRLHHEFREFQVEELVIGKGGPRLKETSDDPAVLPPGPPMLKDGELLTPGVVSRVSPGAPPKVHTMARAQPISQLTAMLSNQLGHPVLDRTGLTGRYDFTLDYGASGMGPGPAPPVEADAGDTEPDIAAAVQQQLGLRLLAGKAEINVLIVDKLEKVPVAN